MKKRILSFCLLLAMVVTALPLAAMTVFSAGASDLYKEEDYNALYVQKDLVIAFDFFKTNEHWGEEASSTLSDYVWSKTKSFSGTAEAGAILNGYYDLNMGTSTLSASVGSVSNRGIGGLTAEFVGTFNAGGNLPAPNNVRGTISWTGGNLVYSNLGFNNAAQGKLRTGDGKVVSFSVPSPAGKISTLTYSMDIPAFTQNYYQYNSSTSGMNWVGNIYATAWQNNYNVLYEYDEENDCVVKLETSRGSFAYFDYYPVVVTTDRIWDPNLNDGQGGVGLTEAPMNYVVDALPRDGGAGVSDPKTNTLGVGGSFYASKPGFLGVYANGTAAYESEDVYYSTNGHTNMTGNTFFRLWSKVNTKLYAFRQYNHVLSPAEMAQNHMADIAKFFRIDIGYIRLLNEASLVELRNYAATLTFEDAEAGDKLASKAAELVAAMYEGKLSPASLAIIAENNINIDGIRLFPDVHATVIFAALDDYIAVPGRVAAEIQAFIDYKVNETLETYYGSYIDKTVYDYRNIYVRQDELVFAVDFFDAKPTDEPLTVGVSYPTWKAKYDAAAVMGLGYWKDLKDDEGNPLYVTDADGKVTDDSPVKNIAEALKWVYDHDDSENKYKYNNTAGYWMNLVDAEGKPLYTTDKSGKMFFNGVEVASTSAGLSEARKWLTANKERKAEENNWQEVYDKYVWKGISGLSPLDISDASGYYAHNNIRTFGEGRLITGMNNSFSLRFANDTQDVTYQVVTKMSGNPNWQLRGFRANFSGATDKILKLTGFQYNGYTVTGTKDAPKADKIALLNYSASAQVSSVYSTDVTATVDKYNDTGAHYFKYTWNESTKKYDVVEVATAEEGNSGAVSFYGLLDLNLYANGQRIAGMANMPYNAGAPDSLGNAGGNEFFAIRIYSGVLTPDEIVQNHFADLAGYYDFNLNYYYRLSEEERAVVHSKLRTIELGSPAEDAVAAYEEAFEELYYVFASESDASEAFRGFAAKYKLDVTNLLPLSASAQDRVFAHFTTEEKLMGESVAPVLQAELEEKILEIRTNYYAEAYVHTFASFAGFQLKKEGTPGFRTLFTLDGDALQSIRAMYPGADITIGTLLVPAALANEELVTINPEGGVSFHEGVVESTTAYANGYTDEVFEYQGELAYACEYFPEDIKERVSFVNYVAIELEDEDPVLYVVNAKTTPICEGGISLYDLTSYAKKTMGMAYENVQNLINAEEFGFDAILTVGKGNISDYVMVKNDWNAAGVDKIVALIKEYIGIDMRIVTEAEAVNYERCFYVGRNCDVKYEDSDLYGLNASPYTLSVWYFTEENCDAAVGLFEEILEMAWNDGSYTIETGTDYVRRAR